jgi:hypothetical protein
MIVVMCKAIRGQFCSLCRLNFGIACQISTQSLYGCTQFFSFFKDLLGLAHHKNNELEFWTLPK